MMKYKKPIFWAVLAAAVVCIAVAVFMLTKPSYTVDIINTGGNGRSPLETALNYEQLQAYTGPGEDYLEPVPIYKMESSADVEDYMKTFTGSLDADNSLVRRFGDDYFRNNVLFLVELPGPYMGDRYAFKDLKIEEFGTCLNIEFELTQAGVLCTIDPWLAVIEIPRSAVDRCREYRVTVDETCRFVPVS